MTKKAIAAKIKFESTKTKTALGHANDAEEKEENEESKAQYQRPSDRGVGPTLTGGQTRTIGEEWNRQRNPDGTKESSHTLHNDKRETQSPSAEYNFFDEKVGIVKDKLLVDGEYGNATIDVFTAKGTASASATFDRNDVDLGASAGARASSVKVEGTLGNDYVSGNGPAARIGGEAGVRISKDGVTAKLEGEIGGSLIEGEVGLELASPTIFWGWGSYIACEATGGIGLGANAGASFNMMDNKKEVALGVKAAIGAGLGFKCRAGVYGGD